MGADPAIRYEDRIFVTGMTASGKSTLARRLFLASGGRRLLIDPKGEEHDVAAGMVTFTDPTRATNDQGVSWRDAATARFVPPDPYDLGAYSTLYDWIFANGPRWVWLDEAGFALPSSGGNKGGRRVLSQGRSKGIGHLACHTRPRRVDVDLIAQSAHVFVFTLPSIDDRKTIAENIGVPVALLEQHHAELQPHGYLWWNQRARELTICEP